MMHHRRSWLSLAGAVLALSVGVAPACGQADDGLFASNSGGASGGASLAAGSTGGNQPALGSGGSTVSGFGGSVPQPSVGGSMSIVPDVGSGNSVIGSGGVTSLGGAIGVGGNRGNASGPIGARCAADGDCKKGLMCLTSDSGALSGGGPAEGLCTAKCTNDPSLCQTLSPNSLCVGDGQLAYCFEGCTLGNAIGNSVKCSGRSEMACVVVDDPTGTAACLPQCQGIVGECGASGTCDMAAALFSAGLCRNHAPLGLPTGAKCDPLATTDPCRGLCVPFSKTIGACEDGCTVGAPGSCNPSGSAKVDGFCLNPLEQTQGKGDAGLCTKLCDCTADCGHENMKCFANVQVEAGLGRKGVCDIQRPGDSTSVTASIIDTCGG